MARARLIEVQAAQVIGAARYERSDDRETERNGHRPRTMTTKAVIKKSEVSRICAGLDERVTAFRRRTLGQHRKNLQGASWQRCRVHYVRNLLAPVPKAHQEMVAAAFRSIFALTTPDHVKARWDEVAVMLADRFPKAAALMDSAMTDVLAFTAFPREHWRQIWSKNPLERLNKEIRRRTNVLSWASSPTTRP